MSEVTATKEAKATHLTVGCRMPGGVVLQAYKMVKSREVLPGGRYQDIEIAQAIPGARVTLVGYADPKLPVAVDSKGQYGVTHDVPADLFESWVRANAESPLVKNQIVFAANTERDLKAIGKELKDEKNGLEPLDPERPGEKMGRVGRGLKVAKLDRPSA